MEKTIEIPEGYEARIDGNKVIIEPKESEDEKIRKALIRGIESVCKEEEVFTGGFTRKQIVSWLEKQGEQNLANSAKTCKDEPKFPSLSEKEIVCLKRILDFLREEHNSYTGKDFTNEIAVLEWLITHPVLIHSSELQLNQGWQNPAWSEEDEKRFTQACVFIKNTNLKDVDEIEISLIAWLKSLKGRYTWKPSDEQIKAIRLARAFVTDDFDEHPSLSEILIELEEQLKKLKR